MFVTKTGNFIAKSSFVRQVYKPLLTRANARGAATAEVGGLPLAISYMPFHSLRHTHASTLLARGRNIKEVSERLGHSSPEFTLRVYAHLMPGMGKETARVLDLMFGT